MSIKNIKYFSIISIISCLYGDSVQRTQVLMGTYADITLPSEHKDKIADGFKIIKDIELSLSSYDSNAKVFQLNRDKIVRTDRYLSEAVQESIDMYSLTGGYFDITIGSLTKKLYRFGEDERLPSQDEIKNAKLGIKSIKISDEYIELEDNITIDLGGIGKGYAVDKVADYFLSRGINSGTIALSGDIRLLDIGTVYIDSPFTGKPFLKLQTKKPNIAISTSGTYRRFIKNRKYHHLINPKSRKQGKTFMSVTILHIGDNSKIDALATAIGVMNENMALQILSKLPNIGYILVKSPDSIIYGNLEKLIKIY